jgi:hypothetical protein
MAERRDVNSLNRHCERSEAIQCDKKRAGLLRRFAPRNDDEINSRSRAEFCKILSEPDRNPSKSGHCQVPQAADMPLSTSNTVPEM